MCGLIAKSGTVWAVDWYRAMNWSGGRGPHSHGWAGLVDGEWVVRRRSGPLQRPPEPIASLSLRDGTVIGHSRLATDTSESGGLPTPDEGQPVRDTASQWVLAHNGSSDEPTLTAGHTHPSDTRGLLGIVMERGVDALVDPDMRHLYAGAPHAMIVAHGHSVYAIRVDGESRPAHPVYSTFYPDGWLLSSGPVGPESLLLPSGTVAPFPMIGVFV